MINYDEKMVLNSRLVIKMGIERIGKNFVKSMSVMSRFCWKLNGLTMKLLEQNMEIFLLNDLLITAKEQKV